MRKRLDGEYGFRLNFVTAFDATGYSTVDIKIKQPDGTTLTKVGLTDDAAVGDFYYVVEDGDITNGGKGGTYYGQVTINYASKELKSKLIPIDVGASI